MSLKEIELALIHFSNMLKNLKMPDRVKVDALYKIGEINNKIEILNKSISKYLP